MRIKKICEKCGKGFVTKDKKRKYCSKPCRIKKKREKIEGRGQLCWTCKNTNGNDCSWFSKEAKPVEGWTAKPTIIKNNDGIMKSYRITKCPQYVQGRKR